MSAPLRRQAADAKRIAAKKAAARATPEERRAQDLREVIREEKQRGGTCPRVLRTR